MGEEKRRIYKLEVMGAIVTVDDEGDWKVVDNPKEIDKESILILLHTAGEYELPLIPTFPSGLSYAAWAVDKMDGKLLEIDPPFQYEELPEGTVF